MDLSNYLENKLATKKTRIFTADQELAEQIWLYLQKKLPFPRIMKIIKDNGRQNVYNIFNEIRQSECREPLSLFIYKTNKKI